jgi:putative lipoprotein
MLPTAARADDDPWFARDKALHFGASATLAAGGYALGAALFDGVPPRFATGAGLALGAGVAKELADLAGAGHASWRDLAWDVVGTGAGLLLAWSADEVFFSPGSADGEAHLIGFSGRF